jgi:hypothetical protein
MLNMLCRISLLVYAALLLLSVLLLSAPGQRVPIYALMGAVGALAAISAEPKVRLASAVAVILAMVLVAHDHHAGRRLAQRVDAIRQRAHIPPPSVPGTAESENDEPSAPRMGRARQGRRSRRSRRGYGNLLAASASNI